MNVNGQIVDVVLVGLHRAHQIQDRVPPARLSVGAEHIDLAREQRRQVAGTINGALVSKNGYSFEVGIASCDVEHVVGIGLRALEALGLDQGIEPALAVVRRAAPTPTEGRSYTARGWASGSFSASNIAFGAEHLLMPLQRLVVFALLLGQGGGNPIDVGLLLGGGLVQLVEFFQLLEHRLHFALSRAA